MVDAVCAAYFRTKRRHLNASESRTNGNNHHVMGCTDGLAVKKLGIHPRALRAKLEFWELKILQYDKERTIINGYNDA